MFNFTVSSANNVYREIAYASPINNADSNLVDHLCNSVIVSRVWYMKVNFLWLLYTVRYVLNYLIAMYLLH
jgi:hypothetical protein